jgi:hypothetical protein
MRLIFSSAAAVIAAFSIGVLRAEGPDEEPAESDLICISLGSGVCTQGVEILYPFYIGGWRIVIAKPRTTAEPVRGGGGCAESPGDHSALRNARTFDLGAEHQLLSM